MFMKQILKKTVFIDIDKFDEKPGPFCMSYKFDLNLVMLSIQKIGLINKPYVRQDKSGSVDIITGFRRILALKALHWDNVPCIEILDSSISDKELLLLNIYDNLCTRKLNFVEKGMVLNHLSFFFTRDEIYGTFINLLGISGKKEADILIRINEFNDDEKEVVLNESLSIKTIEYLLDADFNSRNEILKWIISLKFNYNQQALFIEYINDISIREGTSIKELLHEEPFTNFMMEDVQNTPQRAKRFIEFLRTRRMPVLTKNEKIFNKIIFHPPFFC